MVNPLVTIIFDLFLIGSAASIVVAMVAEYRTSQGPAIGRARSDHRTRTAPQRPVGARRARRTERMRAA